MKIWGQVIETPDVVMEVVCDRIQEGWSIRRIAHENRWPALILSAWIDADEERVNLYNAALRQAAEYHVDKVKDLADDATVEDYQLKRFQAQTHQWLAAKFDRKRFGDDKTANVGVAVGNITIIHESS